MIGRPSKDSLPTASKLHHPQGLRGTNGVTFFQLCYVLPTVFFFFLIFELAILKNPKFSDLKKNLDFSAPLDKFGDLATSDSHS